MSANDSVRRPSSILTVLLALFLATGFTGIAAAQDATPVGTPAADATPVGASTAIEPIPCDTRYDLPEGYVDGETITCGYLSVPAFHGEPGSPVMRLHVMRLPSTGAAPAEEPLIILTGGPGQNGGSMLPLFLPPSETNPFSYAPLLENQDVILLDQRGTGASEPSLTCPGDVPAFVVPPESMDATPVAATPATPATPVATPVDGGDDLQILPLPTQAEVAAATVQCLVAYQDAGIDLTAFTTENNAADVASLIDALGSGQADLYGISYGSYLGQRVIDRFPERIRSAVLTSIVAPGTDILVRQITGFDQTLTDVFARCAADTDCAAVNPDLEGDLQLAYDRLAAEPVIVPLDDPATGTTFGLPFDGDAFMSLLYLLAFTTQSFGIPPAITQVAAGDDSLIQTLAPALSAAPPTSSGLLATTYCQDFSQPIDLGNVLADAGVRPVLAEGFTSSWTSINAACTDLGLPRTEPGTDAIDSDVPTLLINGGLDPITPPEDAEPVIAGLSDGQEVTVDVLGHDPGTVGGACTIGIIGSYLSAPDQPVDAGCAAGIALDMSPPGFYDEGAATPMATPMS